MSKLYEVKLKQLKDCEKHLDEIEFEYEDASRQVSYTIDEAHYRKLKRQQDTIAQKLENIARQYDQLKAELNELAEKETLSSSQISEAGLGNARNSTFTPLIDMISDSTENNINSFSFNELSDDFKEFLDNTGIKFAHRSCENVSLNDLFVFPNLKVAKESLDDLPQRVSGESLWGYSDRILVLGSEQSGKTTLAKGLFLKALSCGFLPLFIQGENIKFSRIEDQILKLIKTTYICTHPNEFLQRNNIVCIVDDISEANLNKQAKIKLISNLNSLFPRTILLAEDSFGFVVPDFPSLDDYKKLEILPFNNVQCADLIEKWVALEITEDTDDQQVWKKIDDLRHHVDSLVRKNVVPAKPFHILMLLQSFETTATQGLELTAYGHCYQYLIYQALERVHVKPIEVDTYFNVLSELGGAILETPSESIDDFGLDTFFKQYSKKFLPVDQNKVISDLVNSFILKRSETGLKFCYRYLFYFFAAKKLADSLQEGEEAKKKIQELVNTLHLEKASNIVLFLTYHSKDQWILNEILISVMDIFSEEEEITLKSGSLSFIQDFVKGIPELVLENREARQERLESDKRRDLIEERYGEGSNYLEDEENLSEFIAKVNKVFRATEVCGQILRNRLGSLNRSSLESIYEESLSVSLRFLSVFLRFTEYVQEEAIRKIEKTIEQNPNLSDSKITREVESFYLGISYAVILGMLYRIAFSLGSTKGRDIYIKVAESKGSPAFFLIQEIIELQFEKKLDLGKIDKLHTEFSKNPICVRLLKHVVLHHCYTHDVGFRERQKLASMLNIQIQVQRPILTSKKT